ncbi:uncharacterized protein LOC109806277 [Cajanus cajan]|uniref:Uncharacterized protein n=1 Tax=Cajanus cajan TaxID=3821 RepID=A0A151SY31_CAJCA|nr:uncharacterized protein LOC109806277 [Cajanus cajan]KYP59705.1 hypothetical protein KK1_015145 [Cajanus cajan]
MEGLLPLVFKAIKKNRTRRHYECLSSGISMAEISMYPQTHDPTPHAHNHKVPHHNEPHKVGHRRYKSVEDFGSGFQSPQMKTAVDSPKLVRFRSQRMFSCITGV